MCQWCSCSHNWENTTVCSCMRLPGRYSIDSTETVTATLKYCISPLSFSFFSKSRHVCHFTQMSVLQRVSSLLLRHSNIAESSVACSAKQTPMCAYKYEIRAEAIQKDMTALCVGGDVWSTAITVHYTVNALSAGERQMSSALHIVLLKTIALEHCLLAFVRHLFGYFLSFDLIWVVLM